MDGWGQNYRGKIVGSVDYVVHVQMEMGKEILLLSSVYIVYQHHIRKLEVTVKVVQFGCGELEGLEHQGARLEDKTEYMLMLSLLRSSGSHLGTPEEVYSVPDNARYRMRTPAEVNSAAVDG